jgi:hypothetical protein
MKKVFIFLILVFLVQGFSVHAQQNDEAVVFRLIDRGVNLYCSDKKLTEFLSLDMNKGGVYHAGAAEGFERGMNLYYGKISSTLSDFGFGVGGAKNINYSWSHYYFGVLEVLAKLKTPDEKRLLLLVLGDPFFQKFTAVEGNVANGATMLMAYVGSLYDDDTVNVLVQKRIIDTDNLLLKIPGTPRTPIYKKLMNGFFTNNTTLSMQAIKEVNPKLVGIYKRMFCRGNSNAN